MHHHKPSKYRGTLVACLALAVLLVSFTVPRIARAGDGKSVAEQTAVQGITGAQLYAVNCNRCHEERFPKEFTAVEWKTLMLHMRVRANLTADESKKILKYLQSQSGN